MELLEVFGSDLTVVNAARVSFAKESTEFSNQDAKSLCIWLNIIMFHLSFTPKFVSD
jgi:hypothetical protein